MCQNISSFCFVLIILKIKNILILFYRRVIKNEKFVKLSVNQILKLIKSEYLCANEEFVCTKQIFQI